MRLDVTLRYTLDVDADPASREATAARLWAAGALGVWERGGELVAWFDTEVEAPGAGRWEVEPERDWQAEWKAGIAPVIAGQVAVVPAWLRDEAPDVAHVIELDPGQAFGTGHHATTVMCLELLQELDLDGRSVLDVGTGTGVLAIAARMLGADPVRGVDIDADAVDVAERNAATNGVEVAFEPGSVTGDERGRWDVVVANLLTDTVTRLATELVEAVRPGGHLIASGITSARASSPVAAIEAAGGRVLRREDRDGWVGLLVTTDGGAP